MAEWWSSLVPDPPEDTERTSQLAELCRWRDSLRTPQVPAPGGPSWSEALQELELALQDPDDARWDRAMMLVAAVLRLEALVGMIESWAAPRSPR
jgi:hypothetical protein